MSFPITVQFRGIDPSSPLREKIEAHAVGLTRFAPDIRSCRAVVSAERRPHHNGDRYRVDVHLAIGGREIHVGDSHSADPRHVDPYVAVADAFDVARRCIEDLVELRRATARPRRAAKKSA